MQLIRPLEPYIPLAEIFERGNFYEKEDIAFLDSSLENELGRYSILGLKPYLKLVKGETFTVNGVENKTGFEAYVRNYLKEHRRENQTELPLTAGAIGYFSYEYGRKKEGVKTRHENGVDMPDAVLVFYDVFLIEDTKKKIVYIVANGETLEPEKAVEEVETLIRETVRPYQDTFEKAALTITSDFTHEEYKAAIDRMIRYIIEGDIYIANMTRQLAIRSDKAPYDVFKSLRKNNPSPFGGFFHYGDFQVVAASPERFLKVKDHHVVTRPIKGTGKRQKRASHDRRSGEERSEPGLCAGVSKGDGAFFCGRVCHRLSSHFQRGRRSETGAYGHGSDRSGLSGRLYYGGAEAQSHGDHR